MYYVSAQGVDERMINVHYHVVDDDDDDDNDDYYDHYYYLAIFVYTTDKFDHTLLGEVFTLVRWISTQQKPVWSPFAHWVGGHF